LPRLTDLFTSSSSLTFSVRR